MKKTTSPSVIRYIDDTAAQVTKAFEKNACIFGTEEFELWSAYRQVFTKSKMRPRLSGSTKIRSAAVIISSATQSLISPPSPIQKRRKKDIH